MVTAKQTSKMSFCTIEVIILVLKNPKEIQISNTAGFAITIRGKQIFFERLISRNARHPPSVETARAGILNDR